MWQRLKKPTGPVLTVMMVFLGEEGEEWFTPVARGAAGIDCGANPGGGGGEEEVGCAFGCGDDDECESRDA